MHNLVSKTQDFVKGLLENEKSGHDWWHVYRVYKLAINIANQENADVFIVELSALLHDIDDYKIIGTRSSEALPRASKWLEENDVPESVSREIKDIITGLSFKGASAETKMQSLEGKIVQDADRLDAIGAIGISRVFAYGGSVGRDIHLPDVKPQLNQTPEQYMQNKGTSINHFYEKLLLLKDRLNTNAAKKIADERHKYMEDFLSRFYKEWEGLL